MTKHPVHLILSFLIIATGPAITALPQAECQTALPENVKTKVINKLRFDQALDKSFNRLFVSNANRNMWAAMVEGDDAASLWQTRFLLPNGYLVKPRKTQTEQGQFSWQEYGQLLGGGVQDLQPTPKLKPHLQAAQSGQAHIRIARRVLDSVDYVNRWQLNGFDTWSFTFTYHMEPLLPELPKLGPFKGQGTAQINPATGEFDAVTKEDVGDRFGSSLPDRGADEYTNWLASSVSSPTASQPADVTASPTSPAPGAKPPTDTSAECKDLSSCNAAALHQLRQRNWDQAFQYFAQAIQFGATVRFGVSTPA